MKGIGDLLDVVTIRTLFAPGCVIQASFLEVSRVGPQRSLMVLPVWFLFRLVMALCHGFIPWDANDYRTLTRATFRGSGPSF